MPKKSGKSSKIKKSIKEKSAESFSLRIPAEHREAQVVDWADDEEETRRICCEWDLLEPGAVMEKEGVRFLESCENYCELLWNYDAGQSDYYLDNIHEFTVLTKRYGYLLRYNKQSPLGIGYFGEKMGYGLVTLVDLEAGSFIGEYTGQIQVSDGGVSYVNHAGFSSDYAWDYPDFPSHWPDIEISAERAGNALRYANHSFEPNCRVEHTLLEGFWVLFFVAEKAIPARTQLLVNYGEEYWANEIREMVHL